MTYMLQDVSDAKWTRIQRHFVVLFPQSVIFTVILHEAIVCLLFALSETLSCHSVEVGTLSEEYKHWLHSRLIRIE